MPTLEQALSTDRSNLVPVESTPVENKPALPDEKLKSLLKNANQRCPLPPSNNAADSLRQWGQGNDVPKFRMQTPPSNIGGTGSTTSKAVAVVSGSSSSGTTTSLPIAQNVSVTTTVLAPGQIWTGNLQMAKGFLMLYCSASSFSRLELYGTKIGQTLDLSRPVTQGPPNTTIGLILDVALLTSKSWQILDGVGANGDSPQTSTIYATITNLSTGAGKITASFQFVPEES